MSRPDVEGIEPEPRRKAPEVERIPVPRGELCIIVEWCKGCGFCIEFCPREVLVADERFNRKGYHPPRVINADACRNCDLCEMICPDFAIFTVRTEEPAAAGEAESAASQEPGKEAG